MVYNRQAAVSYAHQWAFSRNPRYFNFDGMGGDCTNFCSQCLYAGYPQMNYTRDVGWYYISPSNRAAAWSGVEYLGSFLTRNTGNGPNCILTALGDAMPGDIIQLSFDGARFSHSLFVVQVAARPAEHNILVATHTQDSDNRPLSTYTYERARLLHILDRP